MKTLVLFVVMATARVALADVAEGKVFADRGAAAYKLQHFTEALVLFQRAYREDPDPALLFNMAECQRQLGSFELAARSYRSYVEKLPEAANHDEATQLAAQMDEAALTAQTKPAPVIAAPVLTAASEQPERTPIYKKWWAWTAVGAAVVLGVSIGVGVGVARYNATPTASTALGTSRVQ